ncbi:MAG: redoxin domain-containing protein [Planctomycetes bacterium]|nr:redoxin domain-containing protein [Planctomycetota bacterium]
MLRTLFRIVCALSLALAAATAYAEEDPVPKVGEKAPDFLLRGSDGKDYRLSDYVGKEAVVLAWFPKAFTSG